MKATKSFNVSITILLVLLCGTLFGQSKRPMELADMFKIQRVTDPQLSPDGKWIAFTVTVPSLDQNNTNSDIWIVPASGGSAKRLTDSPKQDRHPRWSPDGQWILFESNRSGAFQIYVEAPTGGTARQITSISTEANGAIWSHDGKNIAFVSGVFPEFSDKPYKESDALNKQKMDAKDASKVKARIITKLLYRHWDSWVEDLRQHLFVVPVDNSSDPRDVTPGDNDAVPTSDTFSAGDDFDFSYDGAELAFTAPPVPVREQAWSTNHEIYTVNLSTGERTKITTNPAADGFPRYSPDGKYIAYRAQSRPNFEADRWQLMLYDRAAKKSVSLTKKFDSNVEAITWSNDSKKLYFAAEEKALKPIWSVSVQGNDVKKVLEGDVNDDITISSDGGTMAFARNSFLRPNEIYTATTDGKNVAQASHVNDDLFAQIDYTPLENVTYTGAAGAKVQMWIIKPPAFDPAKKYPLVYWVHGGPQGAWLGWSYRWCPEVWAAQGYVLALPNPRGSTGFGQKFTDEISRDWGGKVYTDVMNGVAYMEKLPYIDNKRTAAAGASYGGYMMNWLEGHTDKFKTIICHDGVFNFSSMYGATEELWFDEWEHGIPWQTKDYDKFSPNKFAKNFKTPMLIIHSEKDFRIPITEAMQLFTALQRQGVPSKFLEFPDENHWVLKPANSELWHKTIFDWLADYLK